MARLREYERKRSKGATPEPFGEGGGVSAKPIFVVQRHDARRLHYDFRLERDGALASWAVPKGVPLETGQRHLAVHVEDHPLEYATFAGEIPAGQYGAGTVEIWDSGTYDLLEEKRDGGLTVRLEGKRLRGVWTLVPAKLDGDEKNWLLLRKQDDSAPALLKRGPEYSPMLATLSERVPRGSGWSYEVKWDGYRAIARVAGGEATLTSRRGLDMTERFAVVARALERAVRTPDVVLDGEVCALDAEGRASFSVMQQGSGPLVLYVFDVLEVDGEPVTDLPLRERRERLEEVVNFRDAIRLSSAFDDGEALFEAAKEQELEGIVAKKIESKYHSGRRTRDWLKVKTQGRQEFLVAGYTKGQGRRADRFGSLVLAVRGGAELEYVGNVGTGFTEDEIDRLLAKLRPLRRDTTPFAEVPKMPKVRRDDVVWVEPQLVAEVKFAQWTHDGRLRAPVYEGLREDKETTDVHREEEPLPDEIRKGKRTLKLSNLDKDFWPEEGVTKGDLIAYYREVASVLVPHLRDRPFTMKRYPDGWQGKHFFQKDAPSHMPDWIPTFSYRSTSRQTREKRTLRYPLVNDELGLLWMANMGCIDMNTWYSRADKPDRPDWVLFDLDPSPDVGFPEVVRVARLVKDVLDALGLVGVPKTSGADGFHVLVPIQRRHTYAQAREFSEIVAGTLARLHPGLVTTEWAKAKRRGVLIDSNQNGEGKTIASVYSVRPNAGAPVSTPLRWDEVTEDLDPTAFTMEVVLGRVERDGDLFSDVLELKQALGPALREIK